MNFIQRIFRPNDGSREQVQNAVVASRKRVESAANRFEATIEELLERNDTLTGRKKTNEDE